MSTIASKRLRPGLYAVGTVTRQYHVEDVSTLAREYGDTDASIAPTWRITDVTGYRYEWVGDTATKRDALVLVAAQS